MFQDGSCGKPTYSLLIRLLVHCRIYAIIDKHKITSKVDSQLDRKLNRHQRPKPKIACQSKFKTTKLTLIISTCTHIRHGQCYLRPFLRMDFHCANQYSIVVLIPPIIHSRRPRGSNQATYRRVYKHFAN